MNSPYSNGNVNSVLINYFYRCPILLLPCGIEDGPHFERRGLACFTRAVEKRAKSVNNCWIKRLI